MTGEERVDRLDHRKAILRQTSPSRSASLSDRVLQTRFGRSSPQPLVRVDVVPILSTPILHLREVSIAISFVPNAAGCDMFLAVGFSPGFHLRQVFLAVCSVPMPYCTHFSPLCCCGARFTLVYSDFTRMKIVLPFTVTKTVTSQEI